jgi:hypothetical protein
MPQWPSGKDMNLIEFSKIISNPSVISKRQTRGLAGIVEEYPFFQAARFLHLYALKKQRSFRYNDSLKETAAYTTDRELLFDYITTFDFDLHAAPVDLTPEESEITRAEEVTKTIESEENEAKDGAENKTEEVLELGRPLEFKRDESFSFSEWLRLSELKPIDRGAAQKKSGSERKPRTSMDLINDFISKSPRIEPSQSESFEDMALESSIENEELMTETLARVYVEQKKYDKAIAAFTVLSLKYPEKSSFFADRIEAVRNLKNN